MDDFVEITGEGGYGIVRKNINGDAVKITKNQGPYQPTICSLNELSISQMDISPYVLHTKGVKVTENETLIVYPHAQEDLLSHLMREPIKDPKLFFFRLGLGIAALHNNGIVHRDLKPSNILIFPQEKPVIADFGSIHWIYNGLNDIDSPTGTISYMAPEMLIDGKISIKSDVWSFGVLIIEVLLFIGIFERGEETQDPVKDALMMIESRVPHLVPNTSVRKIEGVKELKDYLSTYRELEPELISLLTRIFARENIRPDIFQVLNDPYFRSINIERPERLTQLEIKHDQNPSISPEQWWYMSDIKRTINIVDIGSLCIGYDLNVGTYLIAIDILDQCMLEEWKPNAEVYVYVAFIIAASYSGYIVEDVVPSKFFEHFSLSSNYKFIPSPFLPQEQAILPYRDFKSRLTTLVIQDEYPQWRNKKRLKRFRASYE